MKWAKVNAAKTIRWILEKIEYAIILVNGCGDSLGGGGGARGAI